MSQKVGVQPIGRTLVLRPRDFDLWLTVICSPGLPFNGRHPHNPCNYMDHLTHILTPEGWKADLVWLVDP